MFENIIAWSRIFPNGDERNRMKKALQFYDRLFAELKRKGMEPIVTISHYEIPLYLVKKYGGWRNRQLIEFYTRYAKVLF